MLDGSFSLKGPWFGFTIDNRRGRTKPKQQKKKKEEGQRLGSEQLLYKPSTVWLVFANKINKKKKKRKVRGGVFTETYVSGFVVNEVRSLSRRRAMPRQSAFSTIQLTPATQYAPESSIGKEFNKGSTTGKRRVIVISTLDIT